MFKGRKVDFWVFNRVFKEDFKKRRQLRGYRLITLTVVVIVTIAVCNWGSRRSNVSGQMSGHICMAVDNAEGTETVLLDKDFSAETSKDLSAKSSKGLPAGTSKDLSAAAPKGLSAASSAVKKEGQLVNGQLKQPENQTSQVQNKDRTKRTQDNNYYNYRITTTTTKTTTTNNLFNKKKSEQMKAEQKTHELPDGSKSLWISTRLNKYYQLPDIIIPPQAIFLMPSWKHNVVPSAGCKDYLRAKAMARGLKLYCVTPQTVLPSANRTSARNTFYDNLLLREATCPMDQTVGWTAESKKMCVMGTFRPAYNECLVYSFGIRNDWSFDEASEQQYGCQVHSFDPSIGLDDHMHSAKIHFHNLALGDSDMVHKKLAWKFNRLSTIVKDLGHTNRVIDFLKMDVEFSEWTALDSALQDGVLSKVRQLFIEFHFWSDTTVAYVYYNRILAGLSHAGFVRYTPPIGGCGWKLEGEHSRSYCVQQDLGLINIKYL